MPLLSTTGAAGARAFGLFGKQTAAAFIAATGGTVTTSGNYRIHTFTSSGTFTVTSAPSGKYIDFIVVGGGGGAAFQAGGGAGGFVQRTSQSPSLGSYAVGVGAKGTHNAGGGTNGGDSTFFGVTAIGGGGGGYVGSGGIGSAGGSGGAGSFVGGAALQPTSASGGLGYSGGAGGGGGAGGAGSVNSGGAGYTDTLITGNGYCEGGPLSTDGTYLGPGQRGDGGGYEDDTGTGYDGVAGTVVIRYLYQ